MLRSVFSADWAHVHSHRLESNPTCIHHVMLALSSVNFFFCILFFSRANQLLACIYLAQSVRVRKKFIIWKREKNFTGQKAARRLKVLVMLCSLNFLIHFASTNAGPISEVHRTYVV